MTGFHSLAGRNIVVGVTGGIAAYKSAELIRLLRKRGAEVRVVMTQGAMEFITPLTLQALSGHEVHSELMDPAAEAAMGHIELARWADAILIAPASANTLARIAHGAANDLLSTICLATSAQIFVAPAMNHLMWENAATQANMEILRSNEVEVIGPASGEQACGEVGAGRMVEPADLVAHLVAHWRQGLLCGVNVVITAGPTQEPIDPVRYISNRSSGKMGYAIANAAAKAGANVVLVSGPTNLAAPTGVECVDVVTAQQMYDAVHASIEQSDIFIGVAAVADYRPKMSADKKIKKNDASMSVALERTDDILASVAALSGGPFTVGFAAETHELEQYARGKLKNKKLDMVAANQVGAGQGFEANDNALTVFWDNDSMEIERADKADVARQLIALIAERYHAQTSG